MRTRTIERTPRQTRTGSWSAGVATLDQDQPPFEPAAMPRIGHHFAAVATYPQRAVEISRTTPAVIQRQHDEAEPAPEAPAPDTAAPDSKPVNTAAPEAPQPLSKSTDASGTTTVKDPPTIIHDEYSGATLKDVAAALPKEAGSATFDVAASTEGDPISKTTVDVAQEVHLPKWIERDKQCAAMQKAWDDFYSALKLHEDGHISINQSKFANAHRRYKGQSAASTQAVTDKIKKEAQTAGDEYDDKTKHGLTGNPPTVVDLTATCAQAEGEGEGAGTAQAKLDVSQPGDPYELEADRVADQVMRMADPYSSGWFGVSVGQAALQRKCAECEEEDKKKPDEEEDELDDAQKPKVQRKESGPGIAASGQAVAATRSNGEPLDRETRAFMEPRFGFDFGHVRIHADSEGAEAARSINARAYTLGSDVVFGSGRYAPASSEGRRLLAHELTHVVQQKASTANGSERDSGVRRTVSRSVSELTNLYDLGFRSRRWLSRTRARSTAL
jgi:hypothetical protein